ncbi:MAG: MarR family transcriptional regulator [candidate division Zixibacteria bacterium]|nr:MarR family transcriptional regulator [candidate division Zixibacteria bacterium]MDH3936695.1 MarR family transcriptional regulator [candidate division Zixibacteria bacterium]MDH4034053.1 MarR family transcriptional regulator [candidate division Zixibacteria bacterium]
MVIEELHKVINKILFLKKKSLFQYRGVRFFPSEIHLMLVIRDKTATNATRIAEQLGVTKGAVSQTLSRLEKKGVLLKSKDPYNKNELTLTFTPAGTKALEHYRRSTADLLRQHERIIKSFTLKERAIIQRFLVRLGNTFDEVE